MKVSVQGCGSNFPSGTTSCLSWNNEGVKKALRDAFRASPNEEITHIEVSRDGIRAHFEKKT